MLASVKITGPMYHLPQLYHDIHRTVVEDLDFYRRLADSCRRPGRTAEDPPVAGHHPQAHAHGVRVLELGCGTGRVASVLAAAGHDVVGIDTSEEMLSFAAQHSAGDAGESCDSRGDCAPIAAFAPNLRLIRADMRAFALGERFDLIILGLNGVGHLHTDSDLAAMFGCARRHLAAGGLLVLHLFTGGSGVAPDGGGLVQRALVHSGGRELSWYEMRTIRGGASDLRSQRHEHLTWYFFGDKPDAEPEIVSLDLRIHSPDHLRAVAADAGLTLVRGLAGFDTAHAELPATTAYSAPADALGSAPAITAPDDSPDWIGMWVGGAGDG